MSTARSPLGVCPFCEVEIPAGHTLITYERRDGQQAIWAECPSCGEVVHPE